MYRLLSIFSMLLAASNMAAHSNSALNTDTTHIETAIVQTADEIRINHRYTLRHLLRQCRLHLLDKADYQQRIPHT